jgi:hypothetical protein
MPVVQLQALPTPAELTAIELTGTKASRQVESVG